MSPFWGTEQGGKERRMGQEKQMENVQPVACVIFPLLLCSSCCSHPSHLDISWHSRHHATFLFCICYSLSWNICSLLSTQLIPSLTSSSNVTFSVLHAWKAYLKLQATSLTIPTPLIFFYFSFFPSYFSRTVSCTMWGCILNCLIF